MSVEKIKEWTLKELAAEAGVPERTIRIYISRGLVDPPLRGGRGAAYGEKHKERVELIRSMQARGMMLAEIAHALFAGGGCVPDRPVQMLAEPDTRKMLWFEKDGTLEESQRHLLSQEHQLAALAAPALPEPEIWRSYAVAPDVRVMFKTGASPWRTKAVLAALRRFAVEVTHSNAKEDKGERELSTLE
ncbi:MAG: helix-turn-helix domain-containing protein [Candidatus Aminicenantales bacterium]